MAARGQKTALVMQDGKMVQQGEMAFLEVEGDSDEEFLRLLACGVRFIRSGCSGAQLLIMSDAFDFGENRKERRDDVMDVMNRVVMNLQDNGREVFMISSPLEWQRGTVITITRRIPVNIGHDSD